jgi:hypothetical protein
MKKDTPYHVTEWDWLQLQLKIFCLQVYPSGSKYTASYVFDQPGSDIPVHCAIFCSITEELLELEKTKAEQLQYYRAWVDGEKDILRRHVAPLPTLRDQLDLERHVVFSICIPAGCGAATDHCQIIGDTVRWPLEEILQIKNADPTRPSM